MTTRSSPSARMRSSSGVGCEHVASSRVVSSPRRTFKFFPAPRYSAPGIVPVAPARRAGGARGPAAIECAALAERYRSGHNGADSKSDGGIIAPRGFESHPLRQSSFAAAAVAQFFARLGIGALEHLRERVRQPVGAALGQHAIELEVVLPVLRARVLARVPALATGRARTGRRRLPARAARGSRAARPRSRPQEAAS